MKTAALALNKAGYRCALTPKPRTPDKSQLASPCAQACCASRQICGAVSTYCL